MNEPRVGIIVLAAGASSRMGESKQLLPFRGENLLHRAVRTAIEAECYPVIVVLGADANILQGEITTIEAHAVINQEWTEGMSSSIRCGLEALEAKSPEKIDAAVFMLCDQPFVTDVVIRRLVDTYRARQVLLVASEYGTEGEKTRGVPALFSRALFPELMALRGAQGAKLIIADHAREAAVIAVPEAAFDVDTPDDYRALQNKVASDSEPA